MDVSGYNFQYITDQDTGQNSTKLIKMSGEQEGIVPLVEGNRHYKIYQAWLAEGNTPAAAE